MECQQGRDRDEEDGGDDDSRSNPSWNGTIGVKRKAAIMDSHHDDEEVMRAVAKGGGGPSIPPFSSPLLPCQGCQMMQVRRNGMAAANPITLG